MRARNILYAEDDPDDVVIFNMVFKRATLPHALKCVDDGEVAIHWLSGAGRYANRTEYPLPDILILDLKMPKKSGFEVLEWVRQSKEFERLPVIVLSSSDDPKDVQQAYRLGATTYFVKSASGQEVIQFLRSLP